MRQRSLPFRVETTRMMLVQCAFAGSHLGHSLAHGAVSFMKRDVLASGHLSATAKHVDFARE